MLNSLDFSLKIPYNIDMLEPTGETNPMYTIYAAKLSYNETLHDDDIISKSNVSLEELYDLFDYYYNQALGTVFPFNLEDELLNDYYDIEFNQDAKEEVLRYNNAHDHYAAFKYNDPNQINSFFYALLNEHFVVSEEEAYEWYHNIVDYHVGLFLDNNN